MKQKRTSLKRPSRSSTREVTRGNADLSKKLGVTEALKAFTALVSFVAAVLGLLVLYANNKGAFADLTDDFYGWLYEDAAWTGLFNNFPEGYVDMASMGLSDTSMQIVMSAKRGKIDGAIAERSLCTVGFPHDYKLLRGEVNLLGRTADLVVWDVVGGHHRDYATLSASLEGVILNVEGGTKESRWPAVTAVRLGQHPSIGADTAMDALAGYCANERKVQMEELRGLRDSVPPAPADTEKQPLSR